MTPLLADLPDERRQRVLALMDEVADEILSSYRGLIGEQLVEKSIDPSKLELELELCSEDVRKDGILLGTGAFVRSASKPNVIDGFKAHINPCYNVSADGSYVDKNMIAQIFDRTVQFARCWLNHNVSGTQTTLVVPDLYASRFEAERGFSLVRLSYKKDDRGMGLRATEENLMQLSNHQ